MQGTTYKPHSEGGPGAASLMTSALLKAGRSPTEALQMLERGRGVIASLTTAARSDVSILQEKHQDLHARYTELRDVVALPLQTPDEAVYDNSGPHASSSRHALETLHRSKAATALGEIIWEINSVKDIWHYWPETASSPYDAASCSGALHQSRRAIPALRPWRCGRT